MNFLRNKATGSRSPRGQAPKPRDTGIKKNKGRVDREFWRRLKILLKIVIPNWTSPVVFDLVSMSGLFIIRTILSIYIAEVNGKIVKSIISYNQSSFLKYIGNLVLLALPASFINSQLDFHNKKIALKLRQRLNEYFHGLYVKDMIYYQMINLDSRINNPDQRMTQDIQKWASTMSDLYSNLAKPIIDVALFGYKLAQHVSWRGPAWTLGWSAFNVLCIRVLSPAFGEMRAKEQMLEGEYRTTHTDLQFYSEEVAFLGGAAWEKNHIDSKFNNLVYHLRKIMRNKLYMGTIDGLILKYASNIMGYTILGLPVFGDKLISAKINAPKKGAMSDLTGDYIRNSSLLINLSKVFFSWK